ncbi:MAG TPA: GNAT family N-acetyltransferase [Methanocella sp.]|jgi:ribosomal protein S18 acetylase RimI-like enzyme
MDVSSAGERPETGTTVTQAVEAAFSEAAAGVSELERLYITSLTDRVRRGELCLISLYYGGEVAGAACYRSVDGEAEIVFGFLRPPYRGIEHVFLETVVDVLAKSGVAVIRTGFTWPDAGPVIAAAARMGFSTVHRISMVKEVEERDMFSYVPTPGIQVLPWSPWYFEDACRIMYEESEPADRVLYPLFGSPEGARRLLLSIVQGRHGTFMPGLSAVCQAGGTSVGFLLCALLPDGSVLVLDIAVSKDHRRAGAGTKMLEYLTGKCAALGNRQIVLAVTAGNEAAIRLYKKAGFRDVAAFDQYVLAINRQENN